MTPAHLDDALAAFHALKVSTAPRIRVLLHLYRHGPRLSSEVCRATGVDNGALCAMRRALPDLLKEIPRGDTRAHHGFRLDLSEHMRKQLEKILGE